MKGGRGKAAAARRRAALPVLGELRHSHACRDKDHPSAQHKQRACPWPAPAGVPPPRSCQPHAAALERLPTRHRPGSATTSVDRQRYRPSAPRVRPRSATATGRDTGETTTRPHRDDSRQPPEPRNPGHRHARESRRADFDDRPKIRQVGLERQLVGLNRYGRRRSSEPTASIKPRSSSRLIAPYNVPGPSRTPANASISKQQGNTRVFEPRREARQNQHRRGRSNDPSPHSASLPDATLRISHYYATRNTARRTNRSTRLRRLQPPPAQQVEPH